jgi:hypothetical protein
VLATYQYLDGIAADGVNVYWSASQGPVAPNVSRCAVGGCGNTPAVLWSGDGAGYLTLGPSAFYWAEGASGSAPETVMSCPIAGCGAGPTTQATLAAPTVLDGLTFDGSSLYWTSSATPDSPITQLSLAGGAPTTVTLTPATARQIVSDATALYWIVPELDGILSVGKDGSNLSQIVTGDPGALAVDTNYLYWTDLTANAVYRANKDGSGVVTLASESAGSAIALDGSNVYWGGDTMILECAISGCEGIPTTLASNQAGIAALAVDSTSVYWGTSSLTYAVVKVAK